VERLCNDERAQAVPVGSGVLLMSLIPGARLGPYKTIAPLDEGAVGEVYQARGSHLKRTVAIKVLHPEVSADPERRARVERDTRPPAQP
jgi:serine/threonine protein kinase